MGKHLHFLDNLRTFAVIIAILCLALNGFMVYPDVHSYVPAATQHIGFDLFINAAIPVILAVLFFLSGYCNASTLRIHILREFLEKKWYRLGLPWLFGILFLAPELAYISFISHGGSHDVVQYYSTTYWYTDFTQGQFWFLGIVLALCLCLSAAKALRPHCLQHTQKVPLPGIDAAVFTVILALVLYGANRVGGNHWFNLGYILTFRLDYLALAVFYFLAGIYACKHRWFALHGYVPGQPWFWAFIICCAAYGIVTFCMPAAPAIAAICTALVSLTGTLGLLSAFYTWGSTQTVRTEKLAALSYALYFLSEPLAQNTAFFLNPLLVPAIVKIILILAITFIYGYLISTYALLHLSSFKRQ